MSLTDKVVLVTGATRGIGAAIAVALGASGATVIGTATSEGGANTISEYLAQAGIKGSGQVLNVRSGEDVVALVKQIGSEYGPVQILVNNAGITRDNLMMRMKDEEWDAVMKARWGRIINISSVVGSMGNPGQANYSATKAAVQGFARSLAAEVGSRGITVNSVAPGFIDTDMTKDLPEDNKAAMLSQIPSGRLGQPAEVAAVVAFLASESAAYVTGETIHVNGGMYMS
jgi:3-oxoacyl-[acyl-carrier protein] reductase